MDWWVVQSALNFAIDWRCRGSARIIPTTIRNANKHYYYYYNVLTGG